MARTNRKFLSNGNFREARKGSGGQRGDWWVRDRDLPWARRTNHGGMLMSPSNSGLYRDEQGGKEFKRALKRGQRQRTAAGIAGELLDFQFGSE